MHFIKSKMDKYKLPKFTILLRRVIPINTMIFIIILLTLQSPKETLSLSREIQEFCKSIFPNASGRWIIDMHWFRSLLHLPLYFALGCVVSFQVKKIWNAVAFCGFVALSDEILKIFLSTREFEVRDLAIDAIGFLIGIICVTFFRCLKMRARVIE